MRILLIGSGGREHALAWALGRSPSLTTLHCAPGNAGIAADAEMLDLAATDVEAIVRHAREQRYDLVVVGPEAPLVEGLADRLDEAGIPVFGPSAGAARIEGSKIFSKELMDRHSIPTAGFRVFDGAPEAAEHLRGPNVDYPVVVKADGLAAGKGVIIAADPDEAVAAVLSMLVDGRFGDAGKRVIVEECLRGREASFFVLSDGERFVELATCQDYKRAEDGDQGPNTGGMGTYSPSAFLTDDLRHTILETIVEPTIRGLAAEGTPYRGVLYVGVMLTPEGPKVLEYNARFGDPEAQVLLPRLDGDWARVLLACARGELASVEPLRWKSDAACCVVMTAGGYPGSYGRGMVIDGLDAAAEVEDTVVFHAGTARDDAGRIVSSGGRVLGVTSLGNTLARARERAYRAVGLIHWDGEHHRTDIALDAVTETTSEAGS